jgi:DNA-binding NarL/FixJ family response regulator
LTTLAASGGEMPGGILEREFTERRCDRTVGRKTHRDTNAHNVVACIDVHAPSTAVDNVPPTVVWDLVKRRVERSLRPNDLVCLLGSGRIAVCFGDGADGDIVGALGSRLASAAGGRLSIGETWHELSVSVGFGVGEEATTTELLSAAMTALAARTNLSDELPKVHANGNGDLHDLAKAAGEALDQKHPEPELSPKEANGLLGSNGSNGTNGTSGSNGNGSSAKTNGSSQNGNGRIAKTAALTDRVIAVHLRGQHGLRPARRELIEAIGQRSLGSAHGAAHTNGAPAHRGLSVLVVGITPNVLNRVNPAVEGLVATAVRTGVSRESVSSADPETALEAYQKTKCEVVVLAIGPETATRSSSDGRTPWERWAQITRDLTRAGASVMAVRAGASVAAIATCVREGAVGLLDVAEFAEQLEKIHVNLGSRRLEAENGSRDPGRSCGRTYLPNPYNRLVELTTSEHRVLFHMMCGASASEIADDLIVSLATVRSHIRSILRKLQVSSQLAAVALANGARPELVEPI